MYILSSAVSDNDVPTVTSELDKFIKDAGGNILSSEMLGKKKLAYPIAKTRNGFYVVQTLDLEGKKLQALDNKLRSMEPIIRYLVVNVEDMERRAVKDKAVQDKMRASRKLPKPETAGPEIKLSETELEEKIAQAIGSDDLAK